MVDFLHVLGSPLSPLVSVGALQHWQALLVSSNVLVWMFIVSVLRFDVPAFTMWIVSLIDSRVLRPPGRGDTYWPSVSVIVAGRNPGAAIRRTISSVLDSGYPRVEVLYADDQSTDDSVRHARSFERSRSVRVFASAQHSGKPTNLNLAILMARGELAFVLDADAEIEVGTIHRLVAYFRDPRVGAVSANIFVRNASCNLVTRLQEIEYALNGSIGRLWHARLGMLPILPGVASIFRTSALRELGGYDTGLGDDTDMTIRMRKRGWRLEFALEARIWTDEPETMGRLMRQRIRWARNMVKVRIRKHADFINPRYGWDNTALALDNLVFRVTLPLCVLFAITWGLAVHGGDKPVLFTSLYFFTTVLVFCKVLIANDLARTPPLFDLALVPLYPPYRLLVRLVEALAILRELLRIGLYHPYVPRRIWSEIPHW